MSLDPPTPPEQIPPEKLVQFGEGISKEVGDLVTARLRALSGAEVNGVRVEYVDSAIFSIAHVLTTLVCIRAVLQGHRVHEAAAHLERSFRLCKEFLGDTYDQVLTADAENLFGGLSGDES